MGVCSSAEEPQQERQQMKEDKKEKYEKPKKQTQNTTDQEKSEEKDDRNENKELSVPVEKDKTAESKEEERVFIDTPLQLPPELPDMNREKSIWVLGQNKEEIKAPRAEYKFIRRLGDPGQFGEAWECIRKRDGLKCAVKMIKKHRFMTDPRRSKKYLAAFSREVQIMERLDHKYCIKFYEAFEDSNNLYMAMELCTGGELFDRIEKKKKFSEEEAAEILQMLFEGVAYLHKHGLAHCDLKPDNFLYSNTNEDSAIKIIDFGMAKPVFPHQYHNAFCGTPYYLAPEILLHEGYNLSCDLWSMGVIMFLLLFGFPPFHSRKQRAGGASQREIFDKIKEGFTPEVKSGFGPWFPSKRPVSAEAKDLMASLMEMDTKKRITAQEALNHPWFKKAKNLHTGLDERVLDSLRTFRKTSRFKHMLLNCLVGLNAPEHKILTSSEENMLIKALNDLDADGDGYLSVEELEKAFESTLCSKEMKQIVAMCDIKGDEVISIEELRMVYLDSKVSAKEERLWDAFTKLDKSKNMKLSVEDIKKALAECKDKTFTETEIEEAFKKADLDGNGTIDYDEFLYLWGSKAAPPRPESKTHKIIASQKKMKAMN
mmetsp:Transcript_11629/g.17355  ORF Transcript_11629/g.17355 Transcript_11629/m.17355 type:complete len:599 (-) Transcript_11629:78-1874(-)